MLYKEIAKKIKLTISKLGIADYALLVFFLMVIATFYMLFFRKTGFTTVVLKVTDKNVLYAYGSPPYWYAELFKKGMVEKDSLGRNTAEIVDVLLYDTSPTNKAVYLTIKLKSVYSKRNSEYKYKGTVLSVGEVLRINFQGLLVEGLITNVNYIKPDYSDRSLLIKTKMNYRDGVFSNVQGVEPYLVDAIRVGDKVFDSTGKAVIELIDKKTRPAKRYTFDDLGGVHLVDDPVFLDADLTFRVNVKEINGRYYVFNDIPIVVSAGLPIHLKNISIWPVIISFEEEQQGQAGKQ